MKNIITSLLVCSSLLVCGQKDSSGIQFFEPPDSTGFGTPDGKLVSKEIGTAGGAVTSDDGRIELIFPAGALTANTTISIQPITNPLINGTGKAYRFKPSGTQFKKPVQIIFNYTEEEEENCPPDFMAFAGQDDTGKWSFFDFDTWDSVARRLQGFIEHFSSYTPLNKMKLIPTYQKLRVGDTLLLQVSDTRKKFKSAFAFTHQTQSAIWYVNDFENGSGGNYGHTVPITTLGNPNFKLIVAEYYTPKALPAKSPVKIKAKLLVSVQEKNKETFTVQKTFGCKVELYDEYEILIRDTVEARASMGTFVADSGSFIAKVTTQNVVVTDVMNYTPYMFIKHRPPKPFKLDVYVGEPCKGPVHIGRMRENGQLLSYSQSVTRATDKPPMVLIRFDPGENLAFRFVVKGSRGIGTGVELMNLESVPNLVYFEVSGEEQVHRMGNQENPYTIYIRPSGKGRYVFPAMQ